MVDTHAGAGVYDLGAEAAQRSGEAAAGVLRLLAEPSPPAVFHPLIEAVRACNGGGDVRLYPGSPWLACRGLGPGDTYVGCELRPDDFDALRRALPAGGPGLQLMREDGYRAAAALAGGSGRDILLVDPPYERADDYAQTAELLASRPARQPVLIWTPLKDLETFDAFLSRLEATGPGALQVAQVRLRPLDDPMRMNGCAVVLADAPDLGAEAEAAGGWIAGRLGGPGASVRVERLNRAA